MSEYICPECGSALRPFKGKKGSPQRLACIRWQQEVRAHWQDKSLPITEHARTLWTLTELTELEAGRCTTAAAR